MRVTKLNLINWYNTAVDYNRFPIVQDMIGQPFCDTGSLVATRDESLMFYVNMPGGFPGVTNSVSPVLTMLYNNGSSVSVTNNLFADLNIDSAGNNTIWGIFSPPSSAPYGFFRLKLVLGSVTLLSTQFEFMSTVDANNCSVQVGGSNKTSTQGVRYPWITYPFMTYARVRMVEIPIPGVAEFSSYQKATTGETNNYDVNFRRVRQFKTALYDQNTLQGLDWLLLHDTLILNQQPMTIKEKLSFTSLRGPLNWATFTVYDNSFAEPLMP